MFLSLHGPAKASCYKCCGQERIGEMTTTRKAIKPRSKYDTRAYEFVFEALRFTQKSLNRPAAGGPEDEAAHITGPELLEGIREFALVQFGLMTRSVFKCWGIVGTEDFGQIVFDMIHRGEMRKTEHDQLSDFCDVYDFESVFDQLYRIDVSRVFRRSAG